MLYILFFFYSAATPDIYTYLHTLTLHHALPIFQVSKAISNADLIKAKEIWSSRRARNRLPSPTGKTLLEIAKNNPAAFEGRRVFVTYCDDEDYDEDVKAAIAKKKIELNLPKNSNHLEAYQDWKDRKSIT